MLAVESWLWLCSTALNTWGAQAVNIWQTAATYARAQHVKWCSYNPSQRVLFASSSYRTFSMAPPVGIVEAHVKSELFNSRILPNEFVQSLVGAKRGGTLAEILELLLQRYLPSEPVARVDTLSALEAPLKVAKSFVEALRVFRTWKEQLIVTVRSLHGRPDIYRMFTTIQPLLSSLLHDCSFAVAHVNILAVTNVYELPRMSIPFGSTWNYLR
eukprot:4255832-Amphidinium_carterae.1